MANGSVLPVFQPARGPAQPSVFDRIAVVGLGPVGGAVARATRHAFPSALVIGVDRNDRLELCVRHGAIDIGAADPIVVADADLIVLAVPRVEQERWLGAVAELVPGRAVIGSLRSDEGSPDGAAALPPRLRFIAGHLVVPAPVSDGPPEEAANGLTGASWALAAEESDAEGAKLAAFVRGLGARPVMAGSETGLEACLQTRPDAV